MYTTAISQQLPPTRWVTIERPGPGRPPAVLDPDLDLASGLKVAGMPLRQARLYLALAGGPRTAREAARIARTHRATAYRLLLRLLERGLIVGDGRTPQRFQAVAPEVVLSRLERFLREEADLCANLCGAYASRLRGPNLETGTRPLAADPPEVLSRRVAGTHPVLAELEESRQTLDVVLRPIALPPALRLGLQRLLGSLLRRGVRVRIVTDATPQDQRFVAAVAREAGDPRRQLSHRHLGPVGAHYYLIDARTSVRVPSMGFVGRAPEIAVVDHDQARVERHVQRFESLWAEAAEPLGSVRSTRSYAWRRTAALFDSPGRGDPIPTAELPSGVGRTSDFSPSGFAARRT